MTLLEYSPESLKQEEAARDVLDSGSRMTKNTSKVCLIVFPLMQLLAGFLLFHKKS